MGNRTIVLIVEDEAIVRLCAVALADDAGFDALEAGSAEEAISILESRSDIAVLFTDIEMPGTIDGCELAAIVKRRWPPIKVVMTSGRVFPDKDHLPSYASFLPKPYLPEQLTDALHRPVVARSAT